MGSGLWGKPFGLGGVPFGYEFLIESDAAVPSEK